MDLIVEGERNNLDDRLSELPDSVLISILSLLSPREFVQTCILSKRWFNLWAFVPYLNFSVEYLCRQEVEARKRSAERFKNFVGNILRRRNDTTDVHTLGICHYSRHSSDQEMPSFARNVITYALDHNLKKLILHFFDIVSLPECLFVCQSLEELDLSIGSRMSTIGPEMVRLPKLREMRLHGTNFYSNCFKKLLSGCPLLESLSIEDCELEMDNFSSESLKWLQVERVQFIARSVPPAMAICAPVVENLKFHVSINDGMAITLREMSNVTQANISVEVCDDHGYHFGLLSGLSNVVDLEIRSSDLKEALEVELLKCPTFYELKNMNLGACCMCCAFDAWYSLMKHCPNLETLNLQHKEDACEVIYVLRYGHKHSIGENLMLLEKDHPLSLVQIMYDKLDCAVHKLVQLIVEMTRDVEVEITLNKYGV